jgi:hypothetical protein
MEGVQAQLAESRAQIDAARLLAHRATVERVAGRPARDLIAMLKVYTTEMAVDPVRLGGPHRTGQRPGGTRRFPAARPALAVIA